MCTDNVTTLRFTQFDESTLTFLAVQTRNTPPYNTSALLSFPVNQTFENIQKDCLLKTEVRVYVFIYHTVVVFV